MTKTPNEVHSIWTFLSDKTICGKPIEFKYEALPAGYKGESKVPINVALELEDITCPECKKKATYART